MNADFAARLDSLLRVTGISQRKLAMMTEIPETSISHFISGKRNPSFNNTVKILKALPEADARWLLTGEASNTY